MIFLDTFRNGSDMKCCQSNVDYKNFQKYTMHIKVQSCTKRNLWKRNRCKATDFKRKIVFFHSERVPQLKMSYTEKFERIHTSFLVPFLLLITILLQQKNVRIFKSFLFWKTMTNLFASLCVLVVWPWCYCSLFQ